jgi:hypothetical protein
MSGKRSRQKGHNFEREIALFFRKYYPDAKRNLEYQEGMGVDIANTGDFSIQCKVGSSFSIQSALKEAVKDGKHPLAITKRDREKVIVSMYLDDFEKLLITYLKG